MLSFFSPVAYVTYVFRHIVLLLFVSALTACGGGDGDSYGGGDPAQVTYTYQVPATLNDGWEVGHLDDHSIDTDLITSMMNGIVGFQYTGIDSISIARNNTLVLNQVFRTQLDEFDSWTNNTRLDMHILHSTSKSFTSALVGIAIDQGFISDTDAFFYELFAYASYDNWDTRKANMTLDDALTMRFGILWDEWSEPYGAADNSLTVLTANNDDYAKALLDLPIDADPGTNFVYNTAGSVAIGQALENSVGVPMADFAAVHLFAPLQIVDVRWGETPTGLPNGGSGLFLSTRDMAKFGQLFINSGVWNGEQVISADWITRSVQPYTTLTWTDTSGYGYQWWIDRFFVNGQQIDSYSTRGYGGQYIFCVPSLQLVVTFTGSNYGNDGAGQSFEMMQQYILPAML